MPKRIEWMSGWAERMAILSSKLAITAAESTRSDFPPVDRLGFLGCRSAPCCWEASLLSAVLLEKERSSGSGFRKSNRKISDKNSYRRRSRHLAQRTERDPGRRV